MKSHFKSPRYFLDVILGYSVPPSEPPPVSCETTATNCQVKAVHPREVRDIASSKLLNIAMEESQHEWSI